MHPKEKVTIRKNAKDAQTIYDGSKLARFPPACYVTLEEGKYPKNWQRKRFSGTTNEEKSRRLFSRKIFRRTFLHVLSVSLKVPGMLQ